MDVRPELLQTLHHILARKCDCESQLQRGPRRVELARQAESQAAAALEAAHAEQKRLRLLAADRQQQMKQRESKIAELKEKRNGCKSNREYSVLSEQIAADEQANSVLADEILEALEGIDQQAVAIEQAAARVEAARTETARIAGEVEQRVAVVREELTQTKRELQAAEARLPAEVRPEYQRRVNASAIGALAAVEGETCGNCFQVLTPQVLNLLSMGRSHICSSCNSILYAAVKTTAIGR